MGSLIRTTVLRILTSAEFKAYAYAVLLVGLCALAILWRFTSISSVLDALKTLAPVLQFQSRLWMGVCIIIVYLVGGLVSFPVVVLIPVMAFVDEFVILLKFCRVAFKCNHIVYRRL